MSDGGKGSKPRPFSVDMNTFDSNWDKIFSKKKQLDLKNQQVIKNDEYCDPEDLDDPDRVGN